MEAGSLATGRSERQPVSLPCSGSEMRGSYTCRRPGQIRWLWPVFRRGPDGHTSGLDPDPAVQPADLSPLRGSRLLFADISLLCPAAAIDLATLGKALGYAICSPGLDCEIGDSASTDSGF